MTEIVFYTGVADPMLFTARLTTKLYDEGRRVRIHTPDAPTTEALDKLLWTHQQLAFVPHCRVGAAIALDTPVWVDHSVEHPGDAEHAQVLINLAELMPGYYARFQRVADVVGLAPEQVAAGRARYRQYKDHGYTIVHHDMTEK